MLKLFPLAAIAVTSPFCAHADAQALNDSTCSGTALTGAVRDSTGAMIPGAALTIDGITQTSGDDGRYRFPCVTAGPHQLTARAAGFADSILAIKAPHTAALDVTLNPESVETQVDVDAGTIAPASASSTAMSQTISGSQLQALADDPDDLLRELRLLAAAGGGSPTNVTIAVDGFQGSSKLPPKSSIAYIQVNPDQFSAQYREPPFDGGRVEVYTKPGQPTYHGALFLTNGSPWENARDPFSTSRAALGKQRYGFELTGPVRQKGSDFSLDLEHRAIDNFAAVNAITLDPAGNFTPSLANVATPQALWIGNARIDWQLGPKNTFITSYSANVNALRNVGVGGTSLAETGYASSQYEHMLRFSDITTASPHLMHEARLSLRWDGENDTPNSTAAQVQVAGAFTGGGSTLGPQQLHELNVEIDDDAILTTRRHTLKFGTQFFLFDEHQHLTSNFNGAYTFGGGLAPLLDASNLPTGQTTTISGIEQYRRAQLALPGGTATAFANVAGNPTVRFTEFHDALFIQDDFNPGHGLHLAAGVRYFFQNDPTMLNALVPRLGVLWSNKQGSWTLNSHFGMFSGRMSQSDNAEVLREDGTNRITSTIYNPTYGSPFAAATPIHTVRQYNPHIQQLSWAAVGVGGSHTLPRGFNLSLTWLYGRIWNFTRSSNINAPLDGTPTGPRPFAPNLNILEVQNSGQGNAKVVFAILENHALKRAQFFAGAVYVNQLDDTNDDTFFTPQSAYSNAGEFAHRTEQGTYQIFGNATFKLPAKLQLSGDLHAEGAKHFNITTGFDNNGDGNFNDRPQFAPAGTPGAFATRYGLLVASGGTGVFPRNRGVLPWSVYLDTNLERAFLLTRDPKAEHPQSLTLNLRSSNVLNHLNVTSIGGVLGSPLFGVPYAADNGRRVEAGARYTF